MKKSYVALFLIACLTPFSLWAAVSRDANGWTVVSPSGDTHIIYVSSSTGDDSWSGLLEAPNAGRTDGPLKTIASGVTLLRSRVGHPDWLLLKAGDSWYESIGVFTTDLGGPSADQPMLISSYGNGPRPQLKAFDGGSVFLGHNGDGVASHVYIIGLEFYDPRKDPNNVSEFEKDGGGVSTASKFDGFDLFDGVNDFLIEDCYLHFLGDAIVVQQNNTAIPQNVVIRRNIISDQYQGTTAHGIFGSGDQTLLIEENIFDHNAWNDQAGVPASVFSHHIYIHQTNDLTIKNNLLLRDSSLSMGIVADTANGCTGGLIDNNFIFEGEQGISLTSNSSSAQPGEYNYTVSNNVFLQLDRDNPTGRGLGWGMDITSLSSATISGNTFSNFSLSDSSGSYAIKMEAASSDSEIISSVTVKNNLFYQIGQQALIFLPKPLWASIKIASNTINDGGLGAAIADQEGTFAQESFSNNNYFVSNGSHFAKINTLYKTYGQWVSASSEVGSQVSSTTYVDTSRTLEKYQHDVMGDTAISSTTLLNNFITAVKAQHRSGWDPRYAAAADWNPAYSAFALNNYIRAGFANISSTAAPAQPTGVSAVALSSCAVQVSWNANAETYIGGYILQVSSNNGFAGYVAGYASKNVGNVTTYQVIPLLALTTYYARVYAYDIFGDTSTASSSVSACTFAFALTSISASQITSSACTVGWQTNTAADSQVDYGLTSSYGNSTVVDLTLVTSHSVALSGLIPQTTYHYRVKSRDSGGNLMASQDYTFITAQQGVPNAVRGFRLQ